MTKQQMNLFFAEVMTAARSLKIVLRKLNKRPSKFRWY